MDLRISVTLLFSCVLFYVGLLLYFRLRSGGRDEDSGGQPRGRGGS